MKKNTPSKKENLVNRDHAIIMKGAKKNNYDLAFAKTTEWQKGENFALFSLLKDVPSGITTTDSCFTSNNS